MRRSKTTSKILQQNMLLCSQCGLQWQEKKEARPVVLLSVALMYSCKSVLRKTLTFTMSVSLLVQWFTFSWTVRSRWLFFSTQPVTKHALIMWQAASKIRLVLTSCDASQTFADDLPLFHSVTLWRAGVFKAVTVSFILYCAILCLHPSSRGCNSEFCHL